MVWSKKFYNIHMEKYKKHFRVVFVSCSLILFTNCASLTEQGYEALSESKYDEALRLFQSAVRKDDSDPKAIQGLKTAQQAWIEKKLIDVRLLRLANNIGESEELLNKLIQYQNAWQVFPSGPAFSTQKEEISLLADRIFGKIKKYVENKNPIAAQVEYDKNRSLLIETLRQDTAILEKSIATAGKSYCLQTEKTILPNEYYTYQWLKQTCFIWNEQLKAKKVTNTVKLFKSVSLSSKIAGLTDEEQASLREVITKSFLNSKWYDQSSSVNVSVQFDGKFTSQQSEVDAIRTARYTVQEPYEVSTIRAKEKKEDSSTSLVGVVFGLLFSSPSRERVVDNYNGTETVYTTEYRTVEKNYGYSVIEVNAQKRIQGLVIAKLNDQFFKTEIADQYKFRADRHDQNFPQAGLKPENPRVISHQEWLTAISPTWMGKMTDELKKLWVTRFCQEPDKKMTISVREQMHRCAEQVDNVVPASLNEFYKQNHEVTFDGWKSIAQERVN